MKYPPFPLQIKTGCLILIIQDRGQKQNEDI